MPYVMDSSGYSPVGNFTLSPGYESVGGLAGWPSYQPGADWGKRRYGVLSDISDFLGSLAEDVRNAVTPPPPRIIKDGKVLGVAKKPRAGKPGLLVPATGKMVTRDAVGRAWTSTVKAGKVTKITAAPATAKVTVAAVAAPAPAFKAPTPMVASTPVAAPIATAPIGVTTIASTVVAKALPARGIYGGRLPTATQFAGRPIGVSATTSVAAVPVGTEVNPPTGAWANVARTPSAVKPMFKPRRLNPAFMVVGRG